MQNRFKKSIILFLLTSLFMLYLTNKMFAAEGSFAFTRTGNWPTKVYRGGTVIAHMQVSNRGYGTLKQNGVMELPRNVSIGPGGCGQRFDLGPYQSCILNLIISGATDNTPVLYVCDATRTSCSGDVDAPLLVSVDNNVPSITLSAPSLPAKIIDASQAIYTYTITNSSSATTEPIKIGISGPSGGDAISLVQDQCSDKSLAPNEVCTFGLKLIPQDNDVAQGIQKVISIDYGDGN